MGSGGGSSDEVQKEIGMLLQQQRMQCANDWGHQHSIYRSDSAPPTIEGSQRAVGGLFGRGGETTLELAANGIAPEEYRSDPDYLVFYRKNVNLNPRLAQPLLSKEDCRFAQRIKGGSSVLGDQRKLNNTNRAESAVGRSFLSTPPGFYSKKPVNESELGKAHCSAERGNDRLMGLSGSGLGSQQKSLTEIFQGGLDEAAPISGYPSCLSSIDCIDENANPLNSAEDELATLRQGQTSDTLRSTGNGHCSPAVQNMVSSSSFSYVAALGSALSRGNTPDPVITRAPSPCLTPIGGERVAAAEKRSMTGSYSLNNLSSTLNGSGNLAAALSGLNLSNNGALDGKKTLRPQVEINSDNNRREILFSLQGAQGQAKQQSYLNHTSSRHLNNEVRSEVNKSLFADCQVEKASSGSSYSNGAPASISNGGGNVAAQYQLMGSPSSLNNYGSGGLTFGSGQLGTVNLPPLYENVAAANVLGGNLTSGSNMATSSDSSNLSRTTNQRLGGGVLQVPLLDPMYLHYLGTTEYAAPMAALCNASGERHYLGSSSLNQLEMQKAYHLGSLVSHQKSMHNIPPFSGKNAGSNHHGVYGNQAFGFGVSYPGSLLENQLIPGSQVGALSPMRHNDFVHVRNLAGRQFDGNYNMNERFVSSLLEEFKNNKTKCFELSEIAGQVVQFSADQYGSRFIQQKLETATIGEKNMVYQEIMPHALNLMNDVFGNYVIQKFFEHGLPSQREELGNRLFGHVLPLSLQMYGCRVIQKAIEVVDVDQKIKMVQELDGHVMRCVRDQNGNHVIQKCIECVPENAIKFIVTTFFDQVVTLSTHPYGCRVIQRVLEHCMDKKTQSKVMDEILGSVSMLAQDQYGNYVVQHVLEHGKPHERSAIIKELTGNIVEMSQQKFASNVVEKCLAFGCAAERQHMVDEMLGTTDENEPLQAMMKDQFGNYVVQKVLETCDDRQRELILSRIKVHLTALKKYTYGKHIVARVEKLVAAGGNHPYILKEMHRLPKPSFNELQTELTKVSNCVQKGEWLLNL